MKRKYLPLILGILLSLILKGFCNAQQLALSDEFTGVGFDLTKWSIIQHELPITQPGDGNLYVSGTGYEVGSTFLSILRFDSEKEIVVETRIAMIKAGATSAGGISLTDWKNIAMIGATNQHGLNAVGVWQIGTTGELLPGFNVIDDTDIPDGQFRVYKIVYNAGRVDFYIYSSDGTLSGTATRNIILSNPSVMFHAETNEIVECKIDYIKVYGEIVPPPIHLYNASRPSATDISIGEQFKVTAKATSGLTNLMGVIANGDISPPDESCIIGDFFTLTEVTSGNYEYTGTLTTNIDKAGREASKIIAAVFIPEVAVPVFASEMLTVGIVDAEPPNITNPSPTGLIATATPEISATVTDNLEVDETSFVLSMKHQTETDYTILCSGTECSYDKTTGELSYQVTQSLRVGRWEVKLEAKDKAGNLATLDWNFLVTPRAGLSSQISAMQSLKDQITAFFGSSIERSLVAKIDAAIDSATRALQALDSQDTKLATNQIKTSQNQLKALINEIKAQLGKKIPEDVGGDWINQAEKIITELENVILFLKGELTTAPVKPKTELTTKNGDLNSDGVVDEKDVEVLKKAFGTKQGDSNFNPACDLNSDGKIDLGDFGVLVKEYNK